MAAIHAYYERVPTSSNVADDPSRAAAPPQLPGWPAPARVRAGEMITGSSSMLMPSDRRAEVTAAEACLHQLFRRLRDARLPRDNGSKETPRKMPWAHRDEGE